MPDNRSLNPIERVAVHLFLAGHTQEGESFLAVDQLMRSYLLTKDPLTRDGEDLRDALVEVVDAWTPPCDMDALVAERDHFKALALRWGDGMVVRNFLPEGDFTSEMQFTFQPKG